MMELHGWGRYPRIDGEMAAFEGTLGEGQGPVVARGSGRSYGDSAVGGHVLDMRGHDCMLEFDDKTGILHCQSGVLLADIVETFVPRGWFLKVTPGTQFVTVGGAIAADVHGKNHHAAGCFSTCVRALRLMLPGGRMEVVEPGSELFLATCGGMGLTGIILDAWIELERVASSSIDQVTIKTGNLEETLAAFEAHAAAPYSVAWVDCLARGEKLGRSLLSLGGFAKDGDLALPRRHMVGVPVTPPALLLNRYSVAAFNTLYYAKAPQGRSRQKVGLRSFFYPLDALGDWNRLYGPQGFVQYQFVLPKKVGAAGMRAILDAIAASGEGSFLAVLKLCGKANGNYLSFPMEGYSLALDFKATPKVLALLDRLDAMVREQGGRIYLAKDARMKPDMLAGYAQVETFRALRKKYGMDTVFASHQSQRLGL